MKRFVLPGALVMIAALAALGFVVWLESGRRDLGPAPEASPLIPRLADGREDVARVRLDGSRSATTLAFGEADSGPGWRVEELDGYPAETDSVRRLLRDVAAIRRIGIVTQDPAEHGRFGVRKPGSGDGGVGVSFYGQDGRQLAAVVLGERLSTPGGPLLASVVVRHADSATVWHTDTALRIDADPLAWVRTTVVHLHYARVREVEVKPQRGTALKIRREGSTFEVTGGGDGGPSAPMLYDRLLAVVDHLTFASVRRQESGGEAPAVPTTTLRYRAEDGLEIKVGVRVNETGTWARFAASAPWAGASVATRGAAGKERDQKQSDTLNAARAEADALNQRFARWEYRLPAAKVALVEDWIGDATP